MQQNLKTRINVNIIDDNAIDISKINSVQLNNVINKSLENYYTKGDIDTELDPYSDNPIANSAVANAIKGGISDDDYNALLERIATLEEIIKQIAIEYKN